MLCDHLLHLCGNVQYTDANCTVHGRCNRSVHTQVVRDSNNGSVDAVFFEAVMPDVFKTLEPILTYKRARYFTFSTKLTGIALTFEFLLYL